ncbi:MULTISPECIES: MFS transporter [unclassified Paenibacillus]|uniref:MFS transporter n=1 Tax=unclassified Paenibacillus TaxID=185978 RepID=UPI0024069D9D|nr:MULTISPECIES: MFS transporter [unclassified Paenibacillus]MDF9841693.1 DHA2 family metal-tetracycline-proton antiporter-like MFS transporter [Paenibacillus sp. PastF-2]MDF9848195.1 DHA2 family metal-tetracycline-proton antiporter-like MFS transporter [Paenibacillus sp. PastM-2]MDF9854852.1 DHA2 family metal-tetracycline-proton antiporter-like MFS transporter [Paenibacillus sp. PastF-1]MDH6480122.1 DHA2 family metal-tetracycline-proton antiporter-like MFS transporter [Paenibacillus sp. PastH-
MQTNTSITANNGEQLMRILVFTLIISVMNGTMFNVVLPVISRQFQLSPSQVSWMVSGYLIVYAIGTVTFGKLTDKYSLKNLLSFGLIFLAAGSIFGIVSTQYWMMIVARLLQAVGASVIPALAMIIPIRYFSPEKRGRALGTSAIGVALGSALGPIIAGFVSTVWSWQVLFVIPLLALFTLPFYRKYLGDEKGSESKIDFIGGILLAGTVAALLLALTNGGLGYAVSGIILLMLFILRVRYAAHPFIDPVVLRNKAYTSGLAIAFVLTAISFSTPFITPQLLAQLNELSPAVIGLIMLPSALITAYMGRKGGKLADEKGNPFLLTQAAVLLIFGFICLSSVAGMAPVFIAVSLIFTVLGQSFMQIALSNTISRTLSKEQTGIGMGLFSMLNFIAAAVSTATIGKILDFGTTTVRFNPIPRNGAAFVYSNIYLILALLVAVMAILYFVQFGRGSDKDSAERAGTARL